MKNLFCLPLGTLTSLSKNLVDFTTEGMKLHYHTGTFSRAFYRFDGNEREIDKKCKKRLAAQARRNRFLPFNPSNQRRAASYRHSSPRLQKWIPDAILVIIPMDHRGHKVSTSLDSGGEHDPDSFDIMRARLKWSGRAGLVSENVYFWVDPSRRKEYRLATAFLILLPPFELHKLLWLYLKKFSVKKNSVIKNFQNQCFRN